MSIYKIITNYQNGFTAYNSCHKQTIGTQWSAFKDECLEFRENPTWDEFWDVCHSFGKVIHQKTKIPLHILAYPTIAKHSKRFSETGCVRSKGNCQRKCCQPNYGECK